MSSFCLGGVSNIKRQCRFLTSRVGFSGGLLRCSSVFFVQKLANPWDAFELGCDIGGS